MEQEITPIIKGVRQQDYDVCPHCQSEIFEKSTFVDNDGYVFHRGKCADKSPIDKIDMHPDPKKLDLWFNQGFGG